MTDTRIIVADVLDGLRTLPDGSVHCVVTSPPYWGLRDYGCEGQIGLEATPELYVAKMVEVFREVRRVLRNDGTLWLNLGDSYTSGDRAFRSTYRKNLARTMSFRAPTPERLKPKDLIGIPWRVAFALQVDGWWLRQDIIWHKPNPMPESVTDRCTKAHEYIFLMSKSSKYHYDAESIKEEATGPLPWGGRPDGKISDDRSQGKHGNGSIHRSMTLEEKLKWYGGMRNKRDVWTVATQPYPDAHFATFPPKLVEPCILAGCPVNGVVLDPFLGSGTVASVAIKHGRRWIGIELNPEYAELARKRISKASEAVGLFK